MLEIRLRKNFDSQQKFCRRSTSYKGKMMIDQFACEKLGRIGSPTNFKTEREESTCSPINFCMVQKPRIKNLLPSFQKKKNRLYIPVIPRLKLKLLSTVFMTHHSGNCS